ncbi:MAG: hypothetical protein U0X91_30720 [Spirosomataceae bacterium]
MEEEYPNPEDPGTGNPPVVETDTTTADGLPVNLFTWLGTNTGKATTLAMYQKYNNAVMLDPATGTISISFGMNAAAEKEDLLLMMEQVIQWNANNPPTPVTARIDTIKAKLNKAVPTDGVYDAWELVLFWTLAVKPMLFAPLVLTDSVLNTYVLLAVEKNGGTLATRIQSDVSRTKDPTAPLPNPKPGSDTDNPNPTPTGVNPTAGSNLTPWLVAVVVAILILLYVRFR